VVIGVSPDGVESHYKFKSENNLPFTLLVDGDHAIAEQYGTWGEKSMYGKKYMGINGQILDAQYKVSPKKSVPAVLKALKNS